MPIMTFNNFSQDFQTLFDNNSTKFANFSQVVRDYNTGSLQMEKSKSDAGVSKLFRDAIGVGDNATAPEIRKAMRRNQIIVNELIEQIVEDTLLSGWDDNPFFSKWVERKNLALGDKNDFVTEDDSDLAVMEIAGNHWDLRRQRLGSGRHFSIDTTWLGVAVYAEYERIAMGVDDLTKMTQKINKAFSDYLNETMYNALLAAISANGGHFVGSGKLDSTTKQTFMDIVADVETGSTGSAVIIGTKKALADVYNLTDVAWASDDMKNEKYNTGRFGMIDGTPIVEIPNRFKKGDTTKYILNNDVIFIIPEGVDPFIKLVYEGDTRVKQVTDNTTNMDMTEDYQVQSKIGVGVVTSSKLGMWNKVAG